MHITMKILCIVLVMLMSLEEALCKPETLLEERLFGMAHIRKAKVKFHVGIKEQTQQCTWKFLCSGSLIAPTRVVSAANCFFNDGTTPAQKKASNCLKVFANTEKILDGFSNPVDVLEVTVHPEFENDKDRGYANDIAILDLEDTVEGIKPIPLLLNPPIIGAKCNVYGWGSVATKRLVNDEVVEASVTIIDPAQCKNNFYDKVTTQSLHPTSFCAGDSIRDGRGICQGDVGSPLVCDDMLMGVLSFASKCTGKANPVVYADISKLQDFVKPGAAAESRSALHSASSKLSCAFDLIVFIQIFIYIIAI